MDEVQRASLAEQIVGARERLGWSQRDLAKRAGVAQKTIVALEAGDRTRPSSQRKVQDALAMEPISEVVSRGLDPTTVHLTVDMVRNWLLGMPEDQRQDASTALWAFVLDWKKTRQ